MSFLVAVCLKRVVDSAARIRPTADGTGVDLADIKSGPNPYDEIALEEAIRLKEAGVASEVVALGVGPEELQAVLRQALALGADRAIHVKHASPTGLELDGLQTARALGAVLRPLKPGLILVGRIAIDDQSAQVGGLLAAELDLPFVGEVMRVEPKEGGLRLHHLVDGLLEVVESRLPVVVSAQKGLNEPRYAGIKGIMAAKKKPLAACTADPGPRSIEILRVEAQPPRKPGRIVGEGPAAVEALVALLQSEAKVL